MKRIDYLLTISIAYEYPEIYRDYKICNSAFLYKSVNQEREATPVTRLEERSPAVGDSDVSLTLIK